MAKRLGPDERAAEIHELHEKIGQLVVERDSLTARGRAEPGHLQELGAVGEGPGEPQPAMPAAGTVPLEFVYRAREPGAKTLAVMRRIDEFHTEHLFYGSRQTSRHLVREGLAAGRDRVRRLMRRMGL